MSDERKVGAAAPRGRVTIRDLAEDLGMSVSTISRAFQAESRISERSRQIVLTRAAELGYTANPFARSLVGKRSKIVGVLVSRISSPFYSEILNMVSEELRKDEMTLMLVAAEHVHEIRDGLDMLMAYDPVAVLVISSYASADAIAASPLAHEKLVYVNRTPYGPHSLALAYDNIGAGRKMADYFIDSGHRSLAYLSSDIASSVDHERGSGFKAQCVARGLTAPVVVTTQGFTYEAGMAATEQFAPIINDIDAVFCATDMMALGLMDCLRHRHGIAIPDRLSIAGCDDIAMAGWPSHSLTTLRVPRRAMVKEIVRLIESIDAAARPEHEVMRIPVGEVIVRGSTGVKTGH